MQSRYGSALSCGGCAFAEYGRVAPRALGGAVFLWRVFTVAAKTLPVAAARSILADRLSGTAGSLFGVALTVYGL